MAFLLKGILIGLLFGLPAGAVGALTVQRTLRHGPGAGLLTGLGSSAADCCYASLGAFGLTIVSDLLLQHQAAIHLLGGGLVLFLGIGLLRRKKEAPSRAAPTPPPSSPSFSPFPGWASPAGWPLGRGCCWCWGCSAGPVFGGSPSPWPPAWQGKKPPPSTRPG